MAVIRYGEAMTDFGSPLQQIDLASLIPTMATATLASLSDVNGAVVNLIGTDLT